MRTYILSISLILFFSACSSKHEPLDTVSKVVLEKYFNNYNKKKIQKSI